MALFLRRTAHSRPVEKAGAAGLQPQTEKSRAERRQDAARAFAGRSRAVYSPEYVRQDLIEALRRTQAACITDAPLAMCMPGSRRPASVCGFLLQIAVPAAMLRGKQTGGKPSWKTEDRQ